MAQAWVLIFGLSFNWSYTVSGIYSEAACNDLGKRIQQEYRLSTPEFKCFPYEPRR